MRISKMWSLLIAIILFFINSITVLGGSPSYIFWSEDSTTYLTKYNGSDLTADTIVFNSSAGLAGRDAFNRLQNSTGNGVSLLTYSISDVDTPSYCVDPGDYGYNNTLLMSVSPLNWISPVGCHGSLNQYSTPYGMIQQGTRRVNSDLSSSLISSQKMVIGQSMGDFQGDLFSDDSSQTYIARYDGSPVQLVRSEMITNCVTGAYGVIASFTTGGTYYIKPDGSLISVYETAMINSVGGKAGKYGFFNAGGRSRYVDGDNNTLYNYYTTPLTAFVRIGGCALTSNSTSTHLFNSRTRSYVSWTQAGTITDSISFGDYALVVINSHTYIFRDNGTNTGVKSVDYQLFSANALDLSRATGGYLNYPDEKPLPSADIYGGDGFVNLEDFSVFSSEWLNCYNPQGCL